MSNSDLDKLFGDSKELNKAENLENSALVNSETKEKSVSELLNNEQKVLILKRWETNQEDPPSIEELCELAFPGKNFDGRSKQGREIKKYLLEHDLKPKTKTEYSPKGLLILKLEEQEFIKNNPNMKGAEIASALWNKPFFANNSIEVRTILNYQKELEESGQYKKITDDDETTEEFRPPKTIEQAAARINRNIHSANYDSKKLTPTQKKQCQMLISYMHNPRFVHHMGLTVNADDRALFQNTFVKYIYDKTDLSQEDLDQYLALANEAVAESSIKRTILMLEKEQEKAIQETGRIQMNIVDAIKTSRDEYNACRNRQDKLYKALEIERSKRLNERVGPQFTLLSIVESMKMEESRKTMILEAEKRNEKLKGEIKRLSEFDSLITQWFGTDEDVVING